MSTKKVFEYVDYAPKDNSTWSKKLDNYTKAKHGSIRGAVRMVSSFLNFSKIEDGTLLDIGCGSGWFKKYANNIDYLGLDIMVRTDEEIDFPMTVGKGEQLPFRSDSVDQVLLYATLDHVIDPKNVLRESFRVLKKGGHLYILNSVRITNILRKVMVYGFLLVQKIIYLDFESIARNTKKVVFKKEDQYHTFEFSKVDIKKMLHEIGYKNTLSKDYKNACFFKTVKA